MAQLAATLRPVPRFSSRHCLCSTTLVPRHSANSYPAIATAHTKLTSPATIVKRASSSSNLHPRIITNSTAAATMASQAPPAAAAAADKADLDTKIAALLETSLKETAPTAESAQKTASDIERLYYQHKMSGGDAEDFLWKLWTITIQVAKKVPASDVRQAHLVDVIAKLKAKKSDPVEIWGQKAVMWDDLALFGPCMREAWNIDVKFDGSADDKTKIQEWISLNSFAARLLGAKLQSWMNFGIWELRAGLEEPLKTAEAKNMHLSTASEWLTHAGKIMHTEAAQGVKPDEMEAKMLSSGSLLKGQTGNTTERWQFWKSRLAELSAEVTADVKAKADAAVAQMAKHEA